MRQREITMEPADTKRVKSPTLPFVLVCAGIVVLPTPLRDLLFGEIAKAVNFVAWAGLLLVLLSARPRIDILRMRSLPALIALSMAAWLAIGLPSETQRHLALDLVAYVLPVLIVLYAGEKRLASSARQFLPIWCWFLNVAVTVIALGGIADLVLDQAATRFFAELYGARSYLGLLSQGRMVSFYGHSLVSASMVITAFCSNHLLSIVRKRRVPGYLLVLYVLTMALTTSKSGFILILAGIVLTSFRAGRLRNLVIILVGLGAAYSYGLLDTVLMRLSEGYESGDISTGRNSALEALFSSGSLSFHFFTGHVFNSSDTSLVAALEYPVLRFAYQYSIVFALIFALAYFVFPLFKLMQRRYRRPLLAWLTMTIFVHSYSGITTYGDILLLQSITTMLALVVARESASEMETFQ